MRYYVVDMGLQEWWWSKKISDIKLQAPVTIRPSVQSRTHPNHPPQTRTPSRISPPAVTRARASSRRQGAAERTAQPVATAGDVRPRDQHPQDAGDRPDPRRVRLEPSARRHHRRSQRGMRFAWQTARHVARWAARGGLGVMPKAPERNVASRFTWAQAT